MVLASELFYVFVRFFPFFYRDRATKTISIEEGEGKRVVSPFLVLTNFRFTLNKGWTWIQRSSRCHRPTRWDGKLYVLQWSLWDPMKTFRSKGEQLLKKRPLLQDKRSPLRLYPKIIHSIYLLKFLDLLLLLSYSIFKNKTCQKNCSKLVSGASRKMEVCRWQKWLLSIDQTDRSVHGLISITARISLVLVGLTMETVHWKTPLVYPVI